MLDVHVYWVCYKRGISSRYNACIIIQGEGTWMLVTMVTRQVPNHKAQRKQLYTTSSKDNQKLAHQSAFIYMITYYLENLQKKECFFFSIILIIIILYNLTYYLKVVTRICKSINGYIFIARLSKQNSQMLASLQSR